MHCTCNALSIVPTLGYVLTVLIMAMIIVESATPNSVPIACWNGM